MISVEEGVLYQQIAVLIPVLVDTYCVEQLVVLERGLRVVADTA